MSQYLVRQKWGAGHLSVPVAIARAIPEHAKFEAMFTDEGILFRFVGVVPRSGPGRQPETVDVPTWAKDGAGDE